MRLDIIAGARPNFMKVAPVIRALKAAMERGENISFRLIHTGQHYDRNMSGRFFEELGIPDPDVNLEAGSGSQAEQTAAIMIGYEKVLTLEKPDICMVVGDVNSTLACSVAAKKAGCRVAHVEAGIRSFDLSMPEEINRMATDAITDYFFTTGTVAGRLLRKNGIPKERIFFVGNTMIDTLKANLGRLKPPGFWGEWNLQKKTYLILTLHRPANVDDPELLRRRLWHISENAGSFPVIFPAHPRTAKILKQNGISAFSNIRMVEPMSYLEFMYLVKNARGVLTDSGGITEECTVLKIPCMTLRDSTERPETVTLGTNELIGTSPEAVGPALQKLYGGHWKKGKTPPRWDGRSARRIVDVLLSIQL